MYLAVIVDLNFPFLSNLTNNPTRKASQCVGVFMFRRRRVGTPKGLYQRRKFAFTYKHHVDVSKIAYSGAVTRLVNECLMCAIFCFFPGVA